MSLDYIGREQTTNWGPPNLLSPCNLVHRVQFCIQTNINNIWKDLFIYLCLTFRFVDDRLSVYLQ